MEEWGGEDIITLSYYIYNAPINVSQIKNLSAVYVQGYEQLAEGAGVVNICYLCMHVRKYVWFNCMYIYINSM